MRSLIWVLILLSLAVGAKETKEIEVFVNGVKANAAPVTDLGTMYFPVEPLAEAMGAKVTFSDGMVSLNGRQVTTPPLMIQGEAYLAVDVLAASLGATVESDPVRGIVHLRGAQVGQGSGLPVYSADYKTPEQQEMEHVTTTWKNAGLPGQAMLAEKEKQIQAMEPKTNKAVMASKPDIAPSFPSHPWMNNGENDPGIPDGSANAPPQEAPRYASAGFAHRSHDNGLYKLTVTDVKIAEALKGKNPPAMPKPGYRFVVVFVSQENLTKNLVNPVWFAVRDAAGQLYPATEGLSEFSLAKLRARDVTSGYIVAEVPASSDPVAVELITSPAVSVGFGAQTQPEGR